MFSLAWINDFLGYCHIYDYCYYFNIFSLPEHTSQLIPANVFWLFCQLPKLKLTTLDVSLQVCKKWKQNLLRSEYPHMTCEITGRPCCMGNEAKCRIVSQDECEFNNGTYYENETLCSQVSWKERSIFV